MFSIPHINTFFPVQHTGTAFETTLLKVLLTTHTLSQTKNVMSYKKCTPSVVASKDEAWYIRYFLVCFDPVYQSIYMYIYIYIHTNIYK